MRRFDFLRTSNRNHNLKKNLNIISIIAFTHKLSFNFNISTCGFTTFSPI